MAASILENSTTSGMAQLPMTCKGCSILASYVEDTCAKTTLRSWKMQRGADADVAEVSAKIPITYPEDTVASSKLSAVELVYSGVFGLQAINRLQLPRPSV